MADGDGYGQQRPATALSDYNAVSFAIDQAIAKLHTVKIVQVQAVDTDAKTVDVLPLVQQIDGNSQVTSQGKIYGVPYRSLLFGKNAVVADPAVDDVGVMVCADRDISTVKETHAEAPPASFRQYDQADGIYLGGLFGADPEQYVKFTDTGMELHDKNNNALVSSSTGWLFTGKVTFQQDVVMNAGLGLQGDITAEGGGTYTGDFVTSGKIQSGAIVLDTHHHTAQGAFAPTTGPQP